MKLNINSFLMTIILVLVVIVVYSNISEKLAVDKTRLPEKVELSKGYQKWNTNLRNSDLKVETDKIRLKEKNEVYNMANMIIKSMDDEDTIEEFNKEIDLHRELNQVVFAPSDRAFIDYRAKNRGEATTRMLLPNEARFYGVRDNKLIDAMILRCKKELNCYFDRAFFISNDLFVITEVSRNVNREEAITPCDITELCTYTFKIHVIDLINNSNHVYESLPLEFVLADKISDF